MNANVETESAEIQPVYSCESPVERLRSLWQAEFLSPKDFVRRALMIALVYGLASVCGLREFTSVLNGTTGSVALGWQLSAFLGLLYVVIYLAFVLVMPTLLIAAGILILWKKIVK